MRIYAHRGVSAHWPENTLAAFAAAVDLGLEGIELDVRLSRDGVPVVIHDSTVDRTTNGTGPLTDFTATQLGLLDAGAGQHVPTLAQVLELASGKVRVNLEIKDPDAVAALVALVAGMPELDFFISGSRWPALAAAAGAHPGIRIYPLTFVEAVQALAPAGLGALGAAVEFALAHKGNGVSVCEQGLEQADVDAVHAAGLEVWAWTVNDVTRARELQQLGVDAICTDDPLLVRNGLPVLLPSSPLGR
ncbi:glycerophosphodiester phosphodiesterase family protein [Arthrobacter alpinus]|uniref:glycerophosphodiester phosphodiesterase n=1 Tax=Arthrobacter alpinus TaxID=656366 RepID=UPI0016441C34|nr:glycerophosphodiester phosphodiesterase family protein [Arthrobacter alpinus]